MTQRLLSAVMVLFIGLTVSAQKVHSSKVYFDSDVHSLDPQTLGSIDTFLESFAYIRSISVSAHTDADGSDGYNMKLAERRGDFVADHIRSIGYKVDETSTFGESLPAASNDSESGKGKNRRVEIIVDGDLELITLDDIYGSGNGSGGLGMQVFCVDNTRDTVIIARGGTSIFIPAYAFRDADLTTCVEIRLNEALNVMNMLSQNIHTTSDGEMLSSGGTLYLEAWSGDQQLPDDLNGELTIGFPASADMGEMEVFYASGTGADMNWQGSRTPFTYVPIQYLADSYEVEYETNNADVSCRLFFCKIISLFDKDYVERRGGLTWSRTYYGPAYVDSAYYNYDEALIASVLAQREAAMEQQRELNRRRSAANALYAGKVNRLNYINCDRFPREPLEEIEVLANTNEFVDIRAIVPSVNGMMYGNNGHGNPSFRLPKRKVIFVAVKIVENQSYLALIESNGREKQVTLAWEALTPEEIKKRMNALRL